MLLEHYGTSALLMIDVGTHAVKTIAPPRLYTECVCGMLQHISILYLLHFSARIRFAGDILPVSGMRPPMRRGRGGA